MPLGAARIALFSKPQVVAQAEVIRRQVGMRAKGNAQVTTTDSVFGGASAVFDGAGDEIAGEPTDIFNVGTGEFTMESQVKFSSTASQAFLSFRVLNASGNNEGGPVLRLNNGVIEISNGAAWFSGSTSISTNTWYHIAASRDSSGTLRIFLDGVADLVTDASAWDFSTDLRTPLIGNIIEGGSLPLNGYIDEVRFSNTARYTTNFTPQTEPHVNDENTLLLLHMDGTPGSQTFQDDNGVRAKESTRAVGSAAISTAQSKSGGSSLELTGSPDIVSIEDKTYFDLQQPQWTVETWFYQETFSSGISVIIGKRSSNFGWLYYTVGNDLVFNRLSADNITATGVISQNVWHHTATVRDGNDYYLFLDGQLVAQEFYTDETSIRRANVEIGRDPTNGTRYWDGYIDEVRISNTARYTANFTPQTEPHVNDENTLLLLHMDGTDGSTDFLDDNGVRQKVGVSAVGNAQVDTAQSQFGGASALFDGSGDYLSFTNWQSGIIGQQDFTVECWLNPITVGGKGVFQLSPILLQGGGSQSSSLSLGAQSGNWTIYYGGNNAGQATDGSNPPQLNTWQHLALVRENNTLKFYVNGVETYTDVDNKSYDWKNSAIGAFYSSSFTTDGYIDEVRISNTVRYTSNFTPPTEPFQNDDNTLLLLHMDGSDGSQTFVDDNGVPPNHDYGA